MCGGQVYVGFTLNVFTCLDFYVKEKILATDSSTQFLLSIQKKMIKLLFLLFDAEL